ncbi:MAG: hypothetical protein VZR02_07495, partial [Lachnospiraceae bacterium]|nr:hypothetical protein [Lachnospiraceae bacterium]
WATSALRTKAFFLHLVIFAAKAGGENRMRSGRRPLCSAPGCPVNCNIAVLKTFSEIASIFG